MPEDSIEPVDDLPHLDHTCRSDAQAEREVLQKAIVLRLNGGLGTSMGLTSAKSLLVAKDGLSFLDIIARQVLALRAEHDARLPLDVLAASASIASTSSVAPRTRVGGVHGKHTERCALRAGERHAEVAALPPLSIGSSSRRRGSPPAFSSATGDRDWTTSPRATHWPGSGCRAPRRPRGPPQR